MKAKEIQDLIDFIANSGLDEVNIETDQFKIKVKKNSEVQTAIVQPVAAAPVAAPAAAPAPAPAASAPAAAEPKAEESASGNYVEIKSPMIGFICECGRQGKCWSACLHCRGHETFQRDRIGCFRYDRENTGRQCKSC